MQTASHSVVDEIERQRTELYYDIPSLASTRSAFLATPRVAFISRFKSSINSPWIDAGEDDSILTAIDSDRSLIIAGNHFTTSTSSQPSLVWLMLDLLCIEVGMAVYEIGTGSGWSTALAAHLVGQSGVVYSSEVESSLALAASARMQKFGLSQIKIKCTAGDFDWADRDADRVIYTTSTFSPHETTIERSSANSRAIFIFQRIGLSDAIISARREGNSFVSEQIVPCYFLPMRKYSEQPFTEDVNEDEVRAQDYRLIEVNRHRSFFISDFAHWLRMNWNDLTGIREVALRSSRYHSSLVSNSSSGCIRLLQDCIDVIGDFDKVDCVRSWLRQWMSDGAPSVLDYKFTISRPVHYVVPPSGTEFRNNWLFTWSRVR